MTTISRAAKFARAHGAPAGLDDPRDAEGHAAARRHLVRRRSTGAGTLSDDGDRARQRAASWSSYGAGGAAIQRHRRHSGDAHLGGRTADAPLRPQSSRPRASRSSTARSRVSISSARVFLDPGDHVVLEDPSYLGAIQAFDAYQTRYLTVDTDEDGLLPESLERVLEHADPFPKFLYLVPNFQNPTGRTLSGPRRERVVRICEHFGLPIVEDDPYGELRFEGSDLPPLAFVRNDGADHLLRHRQQDHGARHADRMARDSRTRRSAKKSCWQNKAPTCTAARSRSTSSTSTQATDDALRRARAQDRANVLARGAASWRRRSPSSCRSGVRFTRPAGGMFLVGHRARRRYDRAAAHLRRDRKSSSCRESTSIRAATCTTACG